eukprot:5910372-Amphidinium_carterae.1
MAGELEELMGGLASFGCFSFILELWGDSEFRNTTTEYIYDTRPGMALLAFDMLWLWMFLSRSFKTFRNTLQSNLENVSYLLAFSGSR